MVRERISVLIVDESELLRSALRRNLRRAAATIRLAASAEEALGLIGSETPDLLVSGYRMEGSMNGLDLLERVHADYPSVRCVLHTGAHPHAIWHVTKFRVLLKPCPTEVLLGLIESVRLGEVW